MTRADPSASFRLWLRVAFLVYAAGILVYRDAIMDDTFIHLQYARHLRAHGTLEFNAGEPSLGATSPLWLLVLAALGATPTAARLASVACGALSVWLFALQARRWCGAGAFSAAATCAWAGNLWLVRHAPNGMESTAAAVLVLLAVELRARPPRRGQAAALGLALAGACLVRPELVLLPLLYLLADIQKRQHWRRLRVWLLWWILPGVAWALFAWWRVGQFVPATVTAKSAGPSAVAWAAVWWREARLVGMAHPVEAAGLLVALVLQTRRSGWRSLGALGRHGLALPLLFAGLLGLAYALMDVQVQPRYLLPALPLIGLAGFTAWRAVWGPSPRAAATLAVLCLGASSVASAVRVLPMTRAYGRGLAAALLPLVLEVEARAAGFATVATPDIGFVGYAGTARVLDLGGLIEPRAQALQQRLGYDAMLASGAFLDLGAAAFVIDRSRERERFAGHVSRDRRWQPLRTTVLANLGLSRPGPYYYTLYALEPVARSP